jgi:hypothetical protein
VNRKANIQHYHVTRDGSENSNSCSIAPIFSLSDNLIADTVCAKDLVAALPVSNSVLTTFRDCALCLT